jgi:uncharacterized membrane protein (DUF373 family)
VGQSEGFNCPPDNKLLVSGQLKTTWRIQKLNAKNYMDRIIKITINILILLLSLIMIYSLVEIVLITLRTIIIKNEIINFLEPKIDKANLFISTVQGLIAAVLLITILIEVIESLREYKQKNSINYSN